jgi:hypothetical protein
LVARTTSSRRPLSAFPAISSDSGWRRSRNAVPALEEWLRRYTEFLTTKRGLATALHSGDPAFDALPGYFTQRLEPALESLLEAAAASGEIRADITKYLLHAVASLCLPVADEGVAYSQRMVALLIDGLRYGADTSQSRS